MPRLSVADTPSDNAIPASSGRVLCIVSAARGSFSWSFGTTYSAEDSQIIPSGESLVLQGSLAQQAISFGPCSGLGWSSQLDITLL